MGIPKNHVKVVHKDIYIDGLVEAVIAELQQLSEGLIEARIAAEYGWEGIERYDMTGYRPMTPAEISADKVARRKKREAAKLAEEKKREAELDELNRLAEKYGAGLIFS